MKKSNQLAKVGKTTSSLHFHLMRKEQETKIIVPPSGPKGTYLKTLDYIHETD